MTAPWIRGAREHPLVFCALLLTSGIISILVVACAGSSGPSGLASTSGADSQGNLPGCDKVRPVVTQTLNDIQAHTNGKRPASASVRALNHDADQLDALRDQAANARLRNAIAGVAAQAGVFAIAIQEHPQARIAGTGTRFLQPFNQLATLCANGKF
jgi:hypothetical protein